MSRPGPLISAAPIDSVAIEDACPRCGEVEMDQLVWNDDCETITCFTCNTSYLSGQLFLN